VKLENQTDEQVKVCIYNTSSIFDNMPCEGGVIFLEPFKNAEWLPVAGVSQATFDVRFFHPELLDKLLARRSDVAKASRVQLSKNGTNYSIAVATP
jgi:hypothetical protein